MLCSRCKCEIEDNPQTIEGGIVNACAFFDISREKLLSPSRKRAIIVPRMMLMKYLNEQGFNLVQIAKAFGKKDHTTPMYCIRTITNEIETYPEVNLQWCEFLNFINQ